MDIRLHFENLAKQLERLETELGSQNTIANPSRLQDLHREHARLAPILEKYRLLEHLRKERGDLSDLIQGGDAELKTLAEEDLLRIDSQIKSMEHELQLALLPKDPNTDRNVILEIRAGTGGDEASLFASDLLRMYTRFSENHHWKMETLQSSMSERGGVKEAVVQVLGTGAWNHLKFESGVHRVQRIPETEANGRIHTSTATVAVLPEAEEVDIEINPSDLRMDTFRASGAGGQHINKTESAVRITHVPTGLVVACQEERSQVKNRAKAMRLLRSRLLQQLQERQESEISKNRRKQVGTAGRSEKIRTYNFPQDRITDHRINFTIHNLPDVMGGNLDALVNALRQYEQEGLLNQFSSKGLTEA